MTPVVRALRPWATTTGGDFGVLCLRPDLDDGEVTIRERATPRPLRADRVPFLGGSVRVHPCERMHRFYAAATRHGLQPRKA